MTTCYQPLGVIEIRPVREAELPCLRELAHTIWWATYPAIISRDQIQFMLDWRYSPEALAQTWREGVLRYELLLEDGAPIGFLGHGPADVPGEWKLSQIYLLPARQKHGLGQRMIRHVAEVARHAAKSWLILTVNRRNSHAIAAYQRAGFAIRESANFAIGNGYVMEDYVMALPLGPDPDSSPAAP